MLLGVILEMKEAAAGLVAGVALEADRLNRHSGFFFWKIGRTKATPVGGGWRVYPGLPVNLLQGVVVLFQGFQGLPGVRGLPGMQVKLWVEWCL